MSQALRYISKLQNQRLLVLGGTSGIGFCVAEAALEYGAQVIVSSSNEAKLSKALDRLQSGITAKGLSGQLSVSGTQCDLSDATKLEENLTKALDFATENRSRLLDHIVFTAGPALKIPKIPEITVEALNENNLVRVVAPTILAKLIPNYVKQAVTSSLTLTSGSTLHRPPVGWAAMTSMSGAVEGLANGLAVDLKPVRVNAVSPGAVYTEIFSDIDSEKLQSVLDGFKEASLTKTVGTPEELAESYIYAMKNSFATGTVILADGGKLLA
ncbi:Short-chain dehydrogenase/reductase malC [Cladobotryum mycophilum]|uniref:Short-chain dehydrogenase/reductase malC n=1 Tax=Cladobotryum mycophilum TaxID=491253 RepID=A0ABR0T4X7_9HYPO